MSTPEEMPNCPYIKHCHCYGTPQSCVCKPSEKALRGWLNGRLAKPMTKEQREWCYAEIEAVEAHDREDYENGTDAELAMGVLNAWQDYCLDKGLI